MAFPLSLRRKRNRNGRGGGRGGEGREGRDEEGREGGREGGTYSVGVPPLLVHVEASQLPDT